MIRSGDHDLFDAYQRTGPARGRAATTLRNTTARLAEQARLWAKVGMTVADVDRAMRTFRDAYVAAMKTAAKPKTAHETAHGGADEQQ